MIVRKRNRYEHGGYHEPPDGFTLEDYIRQMYAESRFDPKAGSPVGAAGLAQIMPSTREYMIGRYNLPETVDVYNPQDARTMQRKYMEDLYGRDWNTGSDENKKLKALAAYNYGPTNVIRALEKAKKQGYDIYDDTSWTKDPKVLPKETRDYLDRTYFATDTAFEKEYSSARPKYFDLFPEDVEQERPTAEAPEPIQKVDPKLQNALEMIPQRPALDPQLKEAFKIMGFKGYKNGGVTVKKYEHGGSHPTAEEKRKQMLQTGNWTEGPDGELLRVPQEESLPPQQNMFGFPTTERAQQLGSLERPLTESELREYIQYGFSPTNPVNTAFSVGAGMHPAGAAADVIGNVVGKGLGLVAQGGRAVMNFLRPASDELADAAQAAYGSIRPNIPQSELRSLTPAQMQEGLETSNRLLSERMAETLTDEGQRRARQQIVDQVTYYDNIARSSDEALERLGFNAVQRAVLRKAMNKYRTADGALDLNSPAIAADLADFNRRMASVSNKSGEVVQRAGMAGKSDEALEQLRSLRDKAYDAGDYQRVADLEDQILQTERAAWVQDKLVDKELTNAFYDSGLGDRSILLGRQYLTDPNYATAATIHEVQHALQDIPSRLPYLNQRLGRGVEADRILEDLVLIDRRNPNITTSPTDDLWDDLSYFEQKAAGRMSEKSPFLAEMREDMLSKGYISNRYQEVTDDLMDRYLKDYYGARNVSTPSTAAGNQNVRILEIMDRNVGPYNRGVLKDAMNKMLVGVPAVGAGVGAMSGDTPEYKMGGKFKVRKAKRYGYSVRKK